MKVISFLGISDYSHTTYTFEGKERYTRFFPAAVAQFLKPDQLLICATPLVQNHQNLRDLIEEAASLGVDCKPLAIPDGNSEADLWEIFDILTATVEDNEAVVFDVTHAFRSLPILAFLAVAYLKAARSVNVQRVLYGAYEARKRDTNISPVFDLTPFVSLLDWLAATNRFVETGDGHSLATLIQQGTLPGSTKRIDTGNMEMMNNLQAAAQAIDMVSMALRLTRPIEAIQAASRLEEALNKARPGIQLHAHPFVLMGEKVVEQYGQFAVEDPLAPAQLAAGLRRQLEMIAWFNQRRHIVQSATLARELVVSILAFKFGCELLDTQARRQIEMAINNSIEKRKKKPRSIEPGIYDDKFEALPQAHDLRVLWSRLGEIRNDIAHVGMRRNAKTAEDLKEEVIALYPKIQAFTEQLLGGQ